MRALNRAVGLGDFRNAALLHLGLPSGCLSIVAAFIMCLVFQGELDSVRSVGPVREGYISFPQFQDLVQGSRRATELGSIAIALSPWRSWRNS